MHTDKDLDALDQDEIVDSPDEQQEENLEWLFDLNETEKEETVFKVEGDSYQEPELSDYEAQIASRPMIRGNESGDDLSNFVDEEIVISSETGASSIYGSGNDLDMEDEPDESVGVHMAVDFTSRHSTTDSREIVFEEGVDILGLAADDDIDETAVTIKRVKSTKETSQANVKVDETVVDEVAEKVEVVQADDVLAQEQSEETVALAGDADALVVQQSVQYAANATEMLDAVAGGDVVSAGSETNEEPISLESLDEAPVTSQVATPDVLDGANEEPVMAEVDVNALASADATQGLASSLPSLLDDDSFDEFLMQSEAVVNDGDIDDLSMELDVEPLEGELSVDVSDGMTIELPEELDLAGTVDVEAVSEIADLMPELIQEISAAAALQSQKLNLNVESVQVEVQLGLDAAAVTQYIADGYLPLADVLNWSPAALALAKPEVVGQVLVRLFDSNDMDQSYNDLFSSEIDVVAEQLLDAAVASRAEGEIEALEESTAVDLDEDIVEGMSSELAETVDSDDDFAGFDAHAFVGDDLVFGSLARFEAETEVADEPDITALDVGSGDDAEDSQFTGFGEQLFAGDDLEFDDFEAPDAEVTEEPLGSELEFSVDSGLSSEPEEVVEGFSDDIFGEGFIANIDEQAGEDASSDIDSLFSALAAPADKIGFDLEALSVEPEPEEEPVAEELSDTSVEDGQLVEANAEVESEAAGSDEKEPVQSDADSVAFEVGQGSDLSWCVPDDIQFSTGTQRGGDIFAEFLDAFIEEGSAEIEKLEDLVGEWEKDVSNDAVVAEVNRRLHTVKGIAKGVGLQRFGTLIHNFETLLEAVPPPASGQEHTYFRMINVWLDAVVRGIEYVTDNREDVASELPAVARSEDTEEDSAVVPKKGKTKGKKAAANKKAEANKKSQPEQSAQDKKLDQELADEGAKALAAQQSVRITSEKLDHLLNLASQSQQLCVRASQSTTRSKRSTAELQGRLSSVRTHIGKIADRALLTVNSRGNSSSEQLDALEMDRYSELQEAASILREGVEDLGDLIELVGRQNSQAEMLLKQQSSVISSISSSIQSARVIPVSRLMPGLRRIVRTVSTDLGKTVTFKVLNEVGALDRDYYARLQVVLEHMVRNALDHGIESAEERLDVGKPSAGLITCDVRKSGGDYIIQLADDGRGINPDAIRESAYEKGIDVDVDALSDAEALRLIFHKGFSTATEVSEISGRGVGMDIVLSELAQIGGEVQIQSTLGQGTTFEVKIPSNVSVNGALMVSAGVDSYAIPLNGLIAVDQVPADEFFAAVHNSESLSLFDMECEPSYLATLCQGVALPERNFWEAFVPVIIAGPEDRRMAIAIDSVEEALELVVRSLGTQFSQVPGLAGAATTADGEAIVALDLNMMVQGLGEEGREQVSVERAQHTNMLALVVDDSRTQRMVATSQLDTVGVETLTAENGLVAIDLLNAAHRLPDVVLLDVEMPVKDGIETLREIRKSQRYGHIPVIMVTSRTGAKHRALAKEAGCNAYMGKPFNFPAMVEQINILTGHSLQLS